MKFLSWLKKIFTPKAPVKAPVVIKPMPPKPEVPTQTEVDNFPPNPLSQIKKVALIVGHEPGAPGADGWNGMSEFNYNSFVAEEVAKMKNLGKEIKVFYRGSSGISGVARKAIDWGPDLVIELHLNAFNKEAHGCEVLVLKGDNASARIGRDFAASFTKKFSRTLRRDQGINWVDDEAGSSSLKALAKAPYAILVEPFFTDNKKDWVQLEEYINFLASWIKGI